MACKRGEERQRWLVGRLMQGGCSSNPSAIKSEPVDPVIDSGLEESAGGVTIRREIRTDDRNGSSLARLREGKIESPRFPERCSSHRVMEILSTFASLL